MIYMYWISLGLASLHKMNSNGSDVDQKPKKIGKFKTDKEAKEACVLHHQRACKMAKAAQGNKNAQRVYADILEAEGKHDWAAFFRAKAEGTTKAFTLEAFLAGKH